MKHDILADMFSIVKNTEAIGRKTCDVPASKLIENVLKIMEKYKFIGGYEFIGNEKNGKYKVSLIGKINDCNVVKPRFSVKKNEIVKWEKRYLPAINIGILILTTNKGIMDQKEAEKQETGGKVLGFIY